MDQDKRRGKLKIVTHTLWELCECGPAFFVLAQQKGQWGVETMNLFHHLKQKHLAKWDDCNKLLHTPAALIGSCSASTERTTAEVCVFWASLSYIVVSITNHRFCFREQNTEIKHTILNKTSCSLDHRDMFSNQFSQKQWEQYEAPSALRKGRSESVVLPSVRILQHGIKPCWWALGCKAAELPCCMFEEGALLQLCPDWYSAHTGRSRSSSVRFDSFASRKRSV